MQERPPAARSWRFASRSMLGAIPDAGPARVEAYAVTKGAEAPTFDAEMQQRAVKPLHTPAPVRARLFEAGLLLKLIFYCAFKMFKMFKTSQPLQLFNILNILNIEQLRTLPC